MVWVDNATAEVDAISEWRTIVTICAVLSAFSITIVCARLWIRQKNHGLAADDWMSVLSMVFALIYSILCIVRECCCLSYTPIWKSTSTKPPCAKTAADVWVPNNRNKIWPRSTARPAPQGEPDPVHALQLCRQTHLPVGHQLLQGRPAHQLPAAVQGHLAHRLPPRRLDRHGRHRRWASGVRPYLDPRLQARKSEPETPRSFCLCMNPDGC